MSTTFIIINSLLEICGIVICRQFQPTRKRAKTGDAKSGGLDPAFEFGQFTQDVWADRWIQTVKKKRKITSTLDEKIKKRVGLSVEEDVAVKDEESGDSSSDEESAPSADEESDEIESDNSISASAPSAKKKLKKKTSTKKPVEEDDILLSDDELQEDKIVVKDKNAKKGKKNREVDEEELQKQEVRLEDDPDYVFETNMSFQQMNLSRPLLKVIPDSQ